MIDYFLLVINTQKKTKTKKTGPLGESKRWSGEGCKGSFLIHNFGNNVSFKQNQLYVYMTD